MDRERTFGRAKGTNLTHQKSPAGSSQPSHCVKIAEGPEASGDEAAWTKDQLCGVQRKKWFDGLCQHHQPCFLTKHMVFPLKKSCLMWFKQETSAKTTFIFVVNWKPEEENDEVSPEERNQNWALGQSI